MTYLASTAALTASIVPSDPTAGVAAVASIALFLIVAFMAFLALAPAVSAKWSGRLDSSTTGAAVEANEAD